MSYPNHLTKFSNEPYKHFMAKACLFWLLRNLKHDIATEWRLSNSYIDLCDKTTHTLYEIVFQAYTKYFQKKYEQYKVNNYDITVIDCSKLPLNINEIKKFLERYIIPD